MVVWWKSATEQQNFICSANLKSIMSACQIFLDVPRLCDLHSGDIFIMFYKSKCNTPFFQFYFFLFFLSLSLSLFFPFAA